jgi:polysaccharide export outer membrane protein
MKKYIYHYLLLLTVLCSSFSLNAAQSSGSISPQQLEQFKKLPPAQQRSLAQSMGVDIRAIQKQMSSSKKSSSDNSVVKNQQYFPRGTKFDENGNPTFEGVSETLMGKENYDGTPKPFGYDVFANAPTTFAPTMDIVVPAHYIIGSGDMLNVQIFGKENFDYELAVSREGKIVVPGLGPFSVAGLTFLEMKEYLANEIKNKILGIDVVVTLAELRSLRVFVLGGAFKPGSYVLNSLSSITHALFAAGGINDIGSLRNIQLKRAGKLIVTLDLYDLLISGDSSDDVMLKSGDVIFISPLGQQVAVAGEVRRPAIYELKDAENFEDIIDMAGGLLPSAFPSATVVERFNKNNLRSIVNVDLSDKTSLSLKVKAGDFINVMKTTELFEESITIIGAVTRPGNYQWKEKQKITDLLPNIHAYILDDADLSYGIVVRERDNTRRIDILQFSLFNIMSDSSSIDNLELKPNDKILIFSNNENIKSSLSSLDSLALTSDELLMQEKHYAVDMAEQNSFWQQYGANEYVNKLEEDNFLQNNQTLNELKAEQYSKLSYFSRERLLKPVVEQLNRQAAYGEPVQLIEIVGAVRYPGTYPLAKSGNVKGLINAAGGLLESAYLLNAELTRSTVIDGIAVKLPQSINLNKEINSSKNYQLKSKDRLNVLKIPDWQKNRVIELRGEFKFPGKYTIRRGDKLGDIIARAGGYTEYAHINGSLFTRVKLKIREQQNLLKVAESLRMEIASKSLAQRGNSQMVDYEQAKLLLSDLTKVEPIGRLVVDLSLLKQHPENDVLLENGDVLIVPTKQNSINVIGQVQVATAHIFSNEASVEDYLNLSGGIKQQANAEKIYIIKANGAVRVIQEENWFAMATEDSLAPGDTIVVPLDADYMDSLTLWSTGTQIVYQAAVAIAAIAGL